VARVAKFAWVLGFLPFHEGATPDDRRRRGSTGIPSHFLDEKIRIKDEIGEPKSASDATACGWKA